MESIKVWIPQEDVQRVMNNQKPTKFYLNNTGLVNLSEITITPQTLRLWQEGSNLQENNRPNRQMLFG